ncbi:MAG: glycosyl hydrolase, partial [Candidatus Dormibacteraceae bacterium]
VYAESQYGVVVRYDRATGEKKGVQPQQAAGQPPLRWWWYSPILISPHSHARLYFGSQFLFRSDDRGDTWKAISPDLSRQMDRNQLPVMGKTWTPEAVSKNLGTSFYGEIVAIAESPVQEGLLYVGTDDGLVQVSPDGGTTWKKHETFPGVPNRSFVARIVASSHDVNTVYAAFENHKEGDFRPYLLKSTDEGNTWTSIAANLPKRGSVLAFAEDPVDPNLLFAGTEFGVYFSIDRGKSWIQLSGDFPVISVHDLTIQKRESDLVVASFGRGFYILDDIAALRHLNPQDLAADSILFPVRKAPLYIESMRLGLPGKSFLGASFFTDPNPPFGATFTYYLKDKLLTRKEERKKAEDEAVKAGKTPPYPTDAEFHAEAQETPPALFFTISDSSGKAIRQIPATNAPGFHRVSWDLRYPALTLRLHPLSPEEEIFAGGNHGPLVMPGTYTVSLSQQVDGVTRQVAGPQSFEVYSLGGRAMSPVDHAALAHFQLQLARLNGAVNGAIETSRDLDTRLGIIRRALEQAPGEYAGLVAQADTIQKRNSTILRKLTGDSVLSDHGEPVTESIAERVGTIMEDERMSSSLPSSTDRQSYELASQQFTQVLAQLRALMEGDLSNLQKAMQAAGAPWTPGTIPNWPQE